MDQMFEDSLAELASVSEGDCGCGGNKSMAAADDLGLPSLAELDDALHEFGALSGAADPLFAELELAAADLEDPFQDLGDASTGPALQDLLELAEKNPGLKITISY